MIYPLAILVGLAAGCVFALQPSVNGGLGGSVAHPLQAALISFVTGTCLLLVICLVTGIFPPKFTRPPSQLPWWMWTGGVLGLVIVTTSLIFVPRVGSLLWFATVVTGQIVTATVLDHFGWLGNPQLTASPLRLVGAGLLLAGLMVIVASKATENPRPVEITGERSTEAAEIDANRG